MFKLVNPSFRVGYSKNYIGEGSCSLSGGPTMVGTAKLEKLCILVKSKVPST